MAAPLRILVIDDDAVMRELLDALLGFSGHAVEIVDSGEAGVERLEAAQGGEFDVVLTDLHMPGLQGEALAAKLQATRAATTLLVGMSGSYPTDEETHLLDEFLRKPFTPDQFEAAVEAARHGRSKPVQDERVGTEVLDEDVFSRLAATLPVAQLRGMYELTLDDVEARVQRMRAAVDVGDLATARREAHAIKGGCGMVGARELYALASTTEGGADAGTMPLADFGPACARLKGMLDARLSEGS